MNTTRKTLITGGAGFIGSHLVDALMNRSVNVHVFDNLSAGSQKTLEDGLTIQNSLSSTRPAKHGRCKKR